VSAKVLRSCVAECIRQKEALRVVEVGCDTINELGANTIHGTWYACPQPWPGHTLLDLLLLLDQRQTRHTVRCCL